MSAIRLGFWNSPLRFVLLMLAVPAFAAGQRATGKVTAGLSHDSIIGIVQQIRRADYEGDRPALKRLHNELTPIPGDAKLASRVLYWRGFALWRRAINGFNGIPDPKRSGRGPHAGGHRFQRFHCPGPCVRGTQDWGRLESGLHDVFAQERPNPHAGTAPAVESAVEGSHGGSSRQSSASVGAWPHSLVVASRARRWSG
jgi:hypothetical protein